jgi:hypothetical protein
MNEHTKLFLAQTREHPLFKDLINEINKQRPVIPTYQPGQSQEETYSLLERIKFESGRKEGFDLALLLLTGEKSK